MAQRKRENVIPSPLNGWRLLNKCLFSPRHTHRSTMNPNLKLDLPFFAPPNAPGHKRGSGCHWWGRTPQHWKHKARRLPPAMLRKQTTTELNWRVKQKRRKRLLDMLFSFWRGFILPRWWQTIGESPEGGGVKNMGWVGHPKRAHLHIFCCKMIN